jgi:hypothetical protein
MLDDNGGIDNGNSVSASRELTTTAVRTPTNRAVVLTQPPSSEFEIEEVRDRLRRHRRRGDAPLGP